MSDVTIRNSNVALIGAHGKVARLAIPQLVERGFKVTGIIRNPQHTEDIESDGAHPVVFDIADEDTESIPDLFRQWDISTVVWSAGAGGGDPQRTWAVDRDAAIRSMDAAREANVDHYVMVSFFGAGENHGVPEDHSFYPYAQAKTEADAHLASSGLSFTLLRPSTLTDNPASGAIDAAAAQRSEVSRGNVAHAIVSAVAQPPAGSPGTRTVEFNDGSTLVDDVFSGSV